jgi:hypothetical protein
MTALSLLFAWALAAVVARRCYMVIYHMDVMTRQCSLLHFWAFGLSYITLFIASVGGAIHITEGQATTGDWLFLLASAGLILSDRRRRKPHTFAEKIAHNPLVAK